MTCQQASREQKRWLQSIWSILDVMANGLFEGGWHLPHCVDGLPGGVFRLAIQILYAPSACRIWPWAYVLASPVTRPKASSTLPPRFLAVPLKRFSSIVTLQRLITYHSIVDAKPAVQRCRSKFPCPMATEHCFKRSSTGGVEARRTIDQAPRTKPGNHPE